MKWLLLIRDWWRARQDQSYRPRYTVPDIRDIREADAAREVRILRLQEEQDRLEAEKKRRLDEEPTA